MNKLLGKYKNGNYNVAIYEDGTKIRYNDLDELIPNTVESMDIKITNNCSQRCEFCHENSTPDGKHGDILSPSFLDNLHPYTELAIGGGNPLEHPDLIPFLENCKEKKFIPSMTVNQIHFEKNYDLIEHLINNKLIYGLGISVVDANDSLIEKAKKFPNAVLHVINGIISINELKKLANNKLKLLILGYKIFRRGEKLYEKIPDIIEKKKAAMNEMLPKIINEKWFEVVSFDNLALEQLDVKSLMTEDQWNEFYLGDDGIGNEYTSASMYVDMVNREFAKNSCSKERYPIMNTVEEMYNFLKTKTMSER